MQFDEMLLHNAVNVLWCMNSRGPTVQPQSSPINTRLLISSFIKIRGKDQNCLSKVKNKRIFYVSVRRVKSTLC